MHIVLRRASPYPVPGHDDVQAVGAVYFGDYTGKSEKAWISPRQLGEIGYHAHRVAVR